MRLKFILSTLCALPLLLPAAELKLPASTWTFERSIKDTTLEKWWYQLIPDGGEDKKGSIRLYNENIFEKCLWIKLSNNTKGKAKLKGRVRFLANGSDLNVYAGIESYHQSTDKYKFSKEMAWKTFPQTGAIGEWQDFELDIDFVPQTICPECGKPLISTPTIRIRLLTSPNKAASHLLALELGSMSISGPGIRSLAPAPHQALKTDRGRLKQPAVPPNFTGNRFDANAAVFDSKKSSLPETFNDSALTDAQRISLNPDFELKLLTPFEQGERANQRARLKFPHPIDPGDPYPTPILADTCDGAFYAVMPNSREFFLAKFDPEKSRWETVREHVTLPAPRKKDDPRLTTAEERFDRSKDSLTRILHPDAPPRQPNIAVPETLLANGGNGFASTSKQTPPAEFQSEKVRKLPVAKAWSSPGSSTLLLGIPNELLWEWNPATGKATQLPLLCHSTIAILPQAKGFLFLQFQSHGAEIRYFPGDSQPSRLLAGTPFSAQRATHLRNLPGGGMLPMESYLGLRGRYLIVSFGPKLALLDLLDPAKSLLLQGFEYRFALIRPDSDFIRVIAQEGMFDLRPKGGWGELTDADFVEVRNNFLTRNNLDSAKLVPLKKLITAVEATDPDLFRAEWKEFDGIDCLVLSWKEIPFNCEVKLDLDQELLEKSPIMLYGFLPRQLSGGTLRPEERKILERVGCYVSGMFYSRFPESGIRLSKGNTLKFCVNQTDSPGELILAAVGK